MVPGGALRLQVMGARMGGSLSSVVPLAVCAPPLRVPFPVPLSLKSFAARLPSRQSGRACERSRWAASAAGPSGAAAPPPRPPPHFADLPLDRSAHLRRDPEALQGLMAHPEARMVGLFEKKALVAPSPSASPAPAAAAALSLAPAGAEAPDGGPPAWILLTWHPQSPTLAGLVDPGVGAIFLGLNPSGAPFFACRLRALPSAVEAELEKGDLSPTPVAAALIDVRSQGQRMTGQDAALLALASGILQWHASAAFCARTGAETTPEAGGHARRAAPAVAAARRPRAVYPRVDPAVIVGVIHGDWLLLGRKKSWDKGRYSLLAGFAECGETLEGALAREVAEESGVYVIQDSACYHSSQPWPFPQSLMVGFLAAAAAQGAGLEALPPAARAAAAGVGLRPEEAAAHALPAVTVDAEEMEDVRWFHAAWLRRCVAGEGPSGGFRIPGGYALANRIISDWLVGAAGPKPAPGAAPATDADGGWPGAAIPDATIDEGVFKYVLMRVSAPGGGPSKLVVRGDRRAAYHNHILTAFGAEVAAVDPSLQVEVLGGGRMEHYVNETENGGLQGQGAVASVYGYSAAFGPAPHEVTAAVLLKANPFLEVTVSYEGY